VREKVKAAEICSELALDKDLVFPQKDCLDGYEEENKGIFVKKEFCKRRKTLGFYGSIQIYR